jgi:hypothetical protein
MKVRKDIIKNEVDVSLSEEELKYAFKSEENLINLMYDIVKNTYGKDFADEMFKTDNY